MPFAGPDVLEFIGGRAIAGIEWWDGVTYRRSMMLPGGHGTVTLRAADDHVAAEFRLADPADLDTAVQRIRRLLDLDADSEAVDAALSAEPVMAPLVAARPGRRAPGSVDPFETSIRAVIGQQISVAGARTVAASLVRAVGEPLALDDPQLTHVFPTPTAVAGAPDAAFPMPTSRRDTLRRLAGAVADGDIVLDAGADPEATRAALLAVKGIGPWTADYITMRGLSHPDVFLDVRPRCSSRSRSARRGDGGAARSEYLGTVAVVRCASPLGSSRSPPGDDTMTEQMVLPTPVGPLVLIASTRGLRAVLWSPDDAQRVPGVEPDEMPSRSDEAPPRSAGVILQQAAEELEEYFDGTRTEFDVPLASRRHSVPATGVVGAALDPVRSDDELRRAGRRAR